MANQKVSQTIRTTVIGTERNTFEIIKEYAEESTVSGDEVTIVQIYPTVGMMKQRRKIQTGALFSA